MHSLASRNTQRKLTQIASTAYPKFHGSSYRPNPFARLPVEIVTEIFLHCLPSDEEESAPSPSQAPLLLCHVSSFWRNAALADPRLWRRLSLNPKQLVKLPSLDPLSKATERMAEQSMLWLHNSKDLGLNMDVNIPISFWDADFYSSESQIPSPMEVADRWDALIVPILVEQGSRLRTLRLSFGVASLLQSFFFEAEGHPHPAMSRLESLTLRGDHLQVADTGDAAWDGREVTRLKRFTSATRLAKVAILVKNRIPFPLQLPRDFLPWEQLTHLMITMPCSGPFWKYVLTQCVKLEAGYINIEHCIAPPELDCDPPLPACGYIELPKLRTLDVTFHDEYTSAYFDDFRFPKLQKLLVACDFGSGFPTFTWLPPTQNVNFFMQLRNLTSLTLSYQNMTEVELLGLLKHTVQLEDLVLDSYLVDHKTFLQALIVKPDSGSTSSDPPTGSLSQEGVQSREVDGFRRRMSLDGLCDAGLGGLDEKDQVPLLPKLKMFRFFLEYFADVPPTTFDEEDFLAVMTSRSEVAREVANTLADTPLQTVSKMQVVEEDEEDDEEDGSMVDDDSDDDDDDDDDDVEMSDGEVTTEGLKDEDTPTIIVPPPTPSNTVSPTPLSPTNHTTPSFDALLSSGPPTPRRTAPVPAPISAPPRPQLPPISKFILPICQVELSTDAREPSKFRRLESFEAGVQRHNKESMEKMKTMRPNVRTAEGRTTDFAFKLEFSSPSNWALQDSEPMWY